MKYPIYYLAFLLLFSSCDLTKRIFRKKENTEKSSSEDSTGKKSTRVNEDWSRVGSNLYHRNGSLWVEFDGLSGIEVRPGYGLRAVGNNARLYGNLTSSGKDTISEQGKTETITEQEATTKKTKAEAKETEEKKVEVDRKTQKIAPIIVLIILLILALLYAIEKLKPL